MQENEVLLWKQSSILFYKTKWVFCCPVIETICSINFPGWWSWKPIPLKKKKKNCDHNLKARDHHSALFLWIITSVLYLTGYAPLELYLYRKLADQSLFHLDISLQFNHCSITLVTNLNQATYLTNYSEMGIFFFNNLLHFLLVISGL